MSAANKAIGTTVRDQFSWLIVPPIPYVTEGSVRLTARTDAARAFSPAQLEIMRAVVRHGPANGKGDLRFTSIDRGGPNEGWHGKRASIDFGRPMTAHWPPPTNYRLLWELWQNLIRAKFPGGVGLGHPDNPHVHIDFGRATPYYFLEASPSGRGATYSVTDSRIVPYYGRYRARYGADGLLSWWLDDGIGKLKAKATEDLKKKA